MHYSTLTSKGRITIPAKISQQFHLKPGDRLEFINNGEFITLVPINKNIIGLKGILPKPKKALSCEEMTKNIKKNKAKAS